MFDGQSLIYAPVTSPSWPDRYMASRLDDSESFRVAVQGTTFAQRASTVVARGVDGMLAATDRRVVLVSDGGTSDLLAGLTSAQVLSAMDSYHDARRAAGADYIAIPTVVPNITMTAGQNTQRLALNAALLADPSAAGADLVVDVAALPSLQNAADTAAFYDGQHYTPASTIAVAGLWDDSLA